MFVICPLQQLFKYFYFFNFLTSSDSPPIAAGPFSPVLILMQSWRSNTNILPSPTFPLLVFAPSIIAFAEFIEKKNIQVDRDFVEHRLVNFEHRYAGTLDAIAMIDGKLGILDIKTSQEIYRDYNLQTSAYIAAMRDIVKKIETRSMR